MLVQKSKEQEMKINAQNEAMEDSKYTSERKILSMQNQVNFLLTKDADKGLEKIEEKLRRQKLK